MSAHRAPEDIRKHLDHPVVDGDGDWVEYASVFAEHIRKVRVDDINALSALAPLPPAPLPRP